jgi:hypothetical protein
MKKLGSFDQVTMKNKSFSPELRDVKPNMNLGLPFDSQRFLTSVLVNDAMEKLESKPVGYRRVPVECASELPELVTGHA